MGRPKDSNGGTVIKVKKSMNVEIVETEDEKIITITEVETEEDKQVEE